MYVSIGSKKSESIDTRVRNEFRIERSNDQYHFGTIDFRLDLTRYDVGQTQSQSSATVMKNVGYLFNVHIDLKLHPSFNRMDFVAFKCRY